MVKEMGLVREKEMGRGLGMVKALVLLVMAELGNLQSMGKQTSMKLTLLYGKAAYVQTGRARNQ